MNELGNWLIISSSITV